MLTGLLWLPRSIPTDETPQTDDEANERFVYEVLERALARTVDQNRHFDTLLLGVLATDVALLVLLIGAASAYRPFLLIGTVAAASIASADSFCRFS